MSQSTVNVRRTCRICDLTIMCVHRYPQGLVANDEVMGDRWVREEAATSEIRGRLRQKDMIFKVQKAQDWSEGVCLLQIFRIPLLCRLVTGHYKALFTPWGAHEPATFPDRQLDISCLEMFSCADFVSTPNVNNKTRRGQKVDFSCGCV